MTVGTAYLIYSYSRQLMGLLGEISGQIADFAQAGASLTQIITLLETRPALETGGRQTLPSGALAMAHTLMQDFHVSKATVYRYLGGVGHDHVGTTGQHS